MSLMNLHYRKIASAYLNEFLHPKFTVKIIREPVRWFLKKSGNVMIFNTEFEETVRTIAPQEAVNFIDCLIICSMHYAKECNEKLFMASPKVALESLKAPFYNGDVYKFLRGYLAFTPRENYFNLELADEIENTIL